MAKIISTLNGVVYVGGKVLRAGDDVPAGVKVGEHLLEPVKRTSRKPAAQGK